MNSMVPKGRKYSQASEGLEPGTSRMVDTIADSQHLCPCLSLSPAIYSIVILFTSFSPLPPPSRFLCFFSHRVEMAESPMW